MNGMSDGDDGDNNSYNNLVGTKSSAYRRNLGHHYHQSASFDALGRFNSDDSLDNGE